MSKVPSGELRAHVVVYPRGDGDLSQWKVVKSGPSAARKDGALSKIIHEIYKDIDTVIIANPDGTANRPNEKAAQGPSLMDL